MQKIARVMVCVTPHWHPNSKIVTPVQVTKKTFEPFCKVFNIIVGNFFLDPKADPPPPGEVVIWFLKKKNG